MFAGVVFVTLSQPYMQHQYGKDWARKAPIRLCDRALYGILEKPGQEVILLSQVNCKQVMNLLIFGVSQNGVGFSIIFFKNKTLNNVNLCHKMVIIRDRRVLKPEALSGKH